MKKTILNRCFPLLLMMLSAYTESNAQGTTTLVGNYNLGGQREYAQYLYIGPNAVINLASDWVISSQNIFIAPGAQILGPGKMIIDNPGKFGPLGEARPWAGTATKIDGGGALVMAPVVIRNPNNVVLDAVPVAASGGNITIANTVHTLYIGTNLDFAINHGDGSVATGNDIVLGNYDLKIAAAATITGYGPNRFVVTNGAGHLHKETYIGSFTYPVGITDADYTPAKIINTAANAMHVSVQDTTASAAIESGIASVRRTWNIYADNATTAGGSMIQLQHNAATNPVNFSPASNYVTQWAGTVINNTGDLSGNTTWQHNTSAADDANPSDIQYSGALMAGISMRQRTYGQNANNAFATTSMASRAFFTKTSDVPDLTPSFDIDDQNFPVAGISRDLVVNIYNIGYAATNGSTISFRIIKSSAFTISYSTSSGISNVTGGIPNGNSNWTFTETPGFIMVTANPGVNIAAGSQAVVGLKITRNPGISTSSIALSAAILPGAGGEIKTTNNTVIATIIAN